MSYPWMKLMKGLGGVILSLSFLELLLHLPPFRRFVPLPSPYYNEEVLLRRSLLRDSIAKNGEPEIVLLGSSIARSNVDAETLSTATGKKVFGLGFSAFPPNGLAKSWTMLWSKELKTKPILLVVFRDYDLTLPDEPLRESILMKGRIERGWIQPQELSPIEKLGLSELQSAKYYGALSKALSVARGPFFGSPFETGPLGTRAYAQTITNRRVSELNASAPKIDSAAIDPHASFLINSISELKLAHQGRVIGVLSPSFESAWTKPDARTETIARVRRLFHGRGIPVVIPSDESFVSQTNNYSDFSHYVERGAKEFSRQLGRALKEQDE